MNIATVRELHPPVVYRMSDQTKLIRRRLYQEEFRWRRGQANINTEQRAYRARNPERTQRLNRESRQRLADDVFGAYGGYLCACCDETERKFLTIDHIHGGGTAERKKLGRSGYHFYVWLRLEGFPPGYRVLCINCNLGRQRNGGVCPHEAARGVAC